MSGKLLADFGVVSLAMVALGLFLISGLKDMSDNTTALYEDDTSLRAPRTLALARRRWQTAGTATGPGCV